MILYQKCWKFHNLFLCLRLKWKLQACHKKNGYFGWMLTQRSPVSSFAHGDKDLLGVQRWLAWNLERDAQLLIICCLYYRSAFDQKSSESNFLSKMMLLASVFAGIWWNLHCFPKSYVVFIPVSSSLFTGLQGSDIRCLGFAKKPGHCVYLHGSDAFSDLTSFEWRGLGEGGRIYFTIGSGCQVPRKTRWET